MPKIGEKVLLHAKGGLYPYAWCGVVLEIVTPEVLVLGEVSQLPHTRESGATWLGIAEGVDWMRKAVRVRRRKDGKPVEVMGVAFCTEWVGDLPTQDQH